MAALLLVPGHQSRHMHHCGADVVHAKKQVSHMVHSFPEDTLHELLPPEPGSHLHNVDAQYSTDTQYRMRAG